MSNNKKILVNKIQCKKCIGIDIHKQLVELMKYTRDYSELLPERILEDTYKKVKDNKDKYEDWYLTLKPMSYKFKNGTSDRRHVGIIAQDIKQSLLDSNLSTLDFAGYVEMPTDPDLVEYIEDNTMCTVRYNEFIMLNTHMIQQAYKKIAELEEKIKQLSN